MSGQIVLFVGVATAGSSIRDLFPCWMEEMRVQDGSIFFMAGRKRSAPFCTGISLDRRSRDWWLWQNRSGRRLLLAPNEFAWRATIVELMRWP